MSARGLWRLLGGLVLGLAVLAGGSAAWGQLARQSDTDHQTYWQPISAVEVDSGSAMVKIEAGAADRVTVSENLDWALRRPSVSRTVTGSVLKVSVSCRTPVGLMGCGVTLDIQVPAATAIRAKGSSGTTLVRGVSGEIRARTTSGQVRLDGVSGPIWAWATSGQITGKELASQVVQAAAGSGRVDLSYARSPHSVTATTTSGSLAVSVPADRTRYRVDGRTTSGSWDVDPGLLDSAADRTIDVTTMSGQVSVMYATR
ncbi:hypothetical protein GCM10010193_33460 [Kitasatospora atroaurantiaca]|uniref:Putative adhesin n=1 Tax=Kitasatospora atroaurantiaca TaxID=285545 RepID=A0A561ENK0_9ACTN|nr:DUF4097 family beta strand repeat-containing protein [Kitasatospora atroaurantiaca]TWE17203.1 putative adhesin [Kitasatospora atroaurantiaca]